ncbi:predicted protein [Nematostella vectensis]|uniref:Uncharacterized protein n=1 Tax=Nematostella vectensis TaxID=45351 RepID=A7RV52_NEMVE|nr:predicted protein [Nematostella vectensis]|eukprot:XP_001636751.1 predicted protein [Nematostella vectensis]
MRKHNTSSLLTRTSRKYNKSSLLTRTSRKYNTSSLLTRTSRKYNTSSLLTRTFRKYNTSSLLTRTLRKYNTSSLLTRTSRKYNTSSLLTRTLRKYNTSSPLTRTLRKYNTSSLLTRTSRKYNTSSLLTRTLRKYNTSSLLTRTLRKYNTSSPLTRTSRKYNTSSLLTRALRKHNTSSLLTRTLRNDSHALIRINHQGNVKKESFSYLDKVMIIWFRDVTGRFWNPIYKISLYCKKEPRVALIHWSNLSEKKDSKGNVLIKLSKTRKRQFDGETYEFEFLSDLTNGTDRQDLVKIMKPRHRNTAVQTIDMREDDNRLMLTEDLMNGYSIRPGGRTLHLKNKDGEWVLEIRDPSSSDLRHDVIIKNIEQIINEYFENVLNMPDAEPDTDLGELYMESKELIPPE